MKVPASLVVWLLCLLALSARADDALPTQAVGTFVGEIHASEITRGKPRCKVTSDARITLDVAAHGLARWRGYHRFEIACPGEDTPPSSCWTEGVAQVTAAGPKLTIETLSTAKVAGPVAPDRDVWKCGSVELTAPSGSDLAAPCVRLGSRTSRASEVGAQIGCSLGKDFPTLEKGTLTLGAGGAITFPWELGKKPFVLARVAPAPVNPPPDKLYDDFGCRFDTARRQEVMRDGAIEEYCERFAGGRIARQGPDVITRADGSTSARYVYDDGRLVSGTAWYPNGRVQMQVATDAGVTTKTFFSETGQKTAIERDGFRASWYDDGSPKHEWTRDGDTKDWYAGGQPSHVVRADGSEVAWFENGQRSKELTPQREYSEWYEDGKLALQGKLGPVPPRDTGEGRWIMPSTVGPRPDGRQGAWTWWGPDGAKRMSAQYLDDQLDGPLTVWLSPTGRIEQTWKRGTIDGHLELVDGAPIRHWKQGMLTLWYPGGAKQAEGPAALERLPAQIGSEPDLRWFGRWTHWHENGKPSEQGDYAGGKHGRWQYTDDGGQLVREEVWDHGRLVVSRDVFEPL